jgi:hypothetical protein
MDIEVDRIHLEGAIRGEATRGREIRGWLRQAARVERVALDVASHASRCIRGERSNGLTRAVNDSTREIEAATTGFHRFAHFGLRNALIVVLYAE